MAVVTLEIGSRTRFANGTSFGGVGAYQLLDGTVYFAVDPDDPHNAVITDLGLAPKDADGRVRFSSDFSILRPVEPHRGNRRVLLDVLNRGNRVALRTFNRGPRVMDPEATLSPGDGFLMRQGYTVVWCGWQYDVPPRSGLLSINVPEAMIDGEPISGRVMARFQLSAPAQVQCLADRLMQAYGMDRCYPAGDINDREAVLLVRDDEDASPKVVPRGDWSFARLAGGRSVPDASYVHLLSGFIPGKVYQVIYSTTGAPVVGLGLLATRDVVSFLRYGTAESGNPCAGNFFHAYAFGASQSGRFLRELLYLGLNEDEQARDVFDGLIPHIAGGKRGEFNQRFGQPSNLAKESTGNLFPFSDTEQTDPETGRTDGLFSRMVATGKAPKVFFTNSSTEYWRGDAALVHIDVEGARDIPASDNVRVYHFAGTQHGSGALPLTDVSPLDGSRGQQRFNVVDYTFLLRAALVRLDRWVTSNEAPSPSKHPRLEDHSAAPPQSIAGIFTAIPGVGFPAHPPSIARLDFGKGTGAGIATTLPPTVGKAYPSFVPAVNDDGNETSGIQLPDVSLPLATFTGWNLRHPKIGAPGQVMGLTGATIPFPRTKAERRALGDPRASIEARYASRDDYLHQVEDAARVLLDEGYLLAEDVALVVSQASDRYDLFAIAARPKVKA